MQPHTSSMGWNFNIIFKRSAAVRRSGARVRLTSHLENGSEPSTNCKAHRFLVRGEFFLVALSVGFMMQVSRQTDSRRKRIEEQMRKTYSSPRADLWKWSTAK